MPLLIHEEFTESGVQKFHKKDAFTHPWRVYWYQESKRSKRRLLIHGELLSHGRNLSKQTYYSLLPHTKIIQESLNYFGKECLLTLGRLLVSARGLKFLSSPEYIKHRVLI
jgi:hypothetical protein